MDLGERYLQVVLRFQRLAPSLVEDYRGPAELAAEVEASPPDTLQGVGAAASELRELVCRSEPDVGRADWLHGQLTGIEVACRRLAGERIGYRELVERCHGVVAHQVDEAEFEHAHALLDDALPGSGSLRERLAAWESRQQLSGERLLAGLTALGEELRGHCHAIWELPEGERVVFESVSGEHYLASARYLGDLCTLVRVNERLPLPAWRLGEIVTHEAYPGHHTETVCKEVALVRGRGRRELGVYVYPTPETTMSENVAMQAESLLGTELDELMARCLCPLGIDYDAGTAGAVRVAMELLLPLRANLLLMLDDGRIGLDEARGYVRRWWPGDEAQVEWQVSSLIGREWLPAESCYPEGLRLCRQFVDGDRGRFGRLLREQLTPAAVTTPV